MRSTKRTATLLITILCIFSLSCKNNGSTTVVKVGADEYLTIPGITAADITRNFTNKNFVLNKDLREKGQLSTWECKTVFEEYIVRVTGVSPEEIISIDATAYLDKGPTREAIEFFGYCASLPYSGSDPQRAKQWAMDHFDTGGSTRIGEVEISLSARGDNVRLLRMKVP